MNEAYKTETLKQHGKSYLIEYFYDSDAGYPWEKLGRILESLKNQKKDV